MKPGKKTLTGLLVAACILSGIILAATPKPTLKTIRTEAQLDSLLRQSMLDQGISSSSIRNRVIKIDTSFSRKEYRVEVPPSFSKTSFHLKLHHTLLEYDMDCPARVTFPERDLYIYIANKNTIFRTIRLITSEPLSE